MKDNEQKIGKKCIYYRKFCKKMHNFSENMAKIDALFTKSLTFLRFILNLPPPPLPENLEIYTHAYGLTVRKPSVELFPFKMIGHFFYKCSFTKS